MMYQLKTDLYTGTMEHLMGAMFVATDAIRDNYFTIRISAPRSNWI